MVLIGYFEICGVLNIVNITHTHTQIHTHTTV